MFKVLKKTVERIKDLFSRSKSDQATEAEAVLPDVDSSEVAFLTRFKQRYCTVKQWVVKVYRSTPRIEVVYYDSSGFEVNLLRPPRSGDAPGE